MDVLCTRLSSKKKYEFPIYYKRNLLVICGANIHSTWPPLLSIQSCKSSDRFAIDLQIVSKGIFSASSMIFHLTINLDGVFYMHSVPKCLIIPNREDLNLDYQLSNSPMTNLPTFQNGEANCFFDHHKVMILVFIKKKVLTEFMVSQLMVKNNGRAI